MSVSESSTSSISCARISSSSLLFIEASKINRGCFEEESNEDIEDIDKDFESGVLSIVVSKEEDIFGIDLFFFKEVALLH